MTVDLPSPSAPISSPPRREAYLASDVDGLVEEVRQRILALDRALGDLVERTARIEERLDGQRSSDASVYGLMASVLQHVESLERRTELVPAPAPSVPAVAPAAPALHDAARIRAEAEAEAERVVAVAQAEASRILADARATLAAELDAFEHRISGEHGAAPAPGQPYVDLTAPGSVAPGTVPATRSNGYGPAGGVPA